MSTVTHIDKARGIARPEDIIERLVDRAPRIKRIVVAFVEADDDGKDVTITSWSSQQLAQVLFSAKVLEHEVMREALD